MFALDTNSLIYFFKGRGRVAERLLATPPSEIGVPAIVLYELEVGIAKSSSPNKRRKQLSELVDLVNLLPFGEAEARAAATLRAALEKRGEPIGPIDTLIAGTAVANRALLVTHNTSEFGRVSGLKIVDWY
ncbi:MAG: type II toxin-antitoxin system VapC family toxin [Thermoanaerobaculales bacterium]|jgi:tRNA(fMet)-specific endonuclease VapC|nr:type II toxin-antitoxin system VapC family toxin [Thermoanaerobaculales bacterium]